MTSRSRPSTAPPAIIDLAAAEGEGALVPERLIVSPTVGTFRPVEPAVVTAEGEIVFEGQVVGLVISGDDATAVVSHVRGFLMGMLADAGERVRQGQPIAWVRAL